MKLVLRDVTGQLKLRWGSVLLLPLLLLLFLNSSKAYSATPTPTPTPTPPSLSISVGGFAPSPVYAEEDETTNASGTVLNAPSGTQECTYSPKWTWGVGSTPSASFSITPSTNQSASVAIKAKFPSPGTYTVTVSATVTYQSSCGNLSASATKTFTVDVKPVPLNVEVKVKRPGSRETWTTADSSAKVPAYSGNADVRVRLTKVTNGQPASGIRLDIAKVTGGNAGVEGYVAGKLYMNTDTSGVVPTDSDGAVYGNYIAGNRIETPGIEVGVTDRGKGTGTVDQAWDSVNADDWQPPEIIYYGEPTKVAFKLKMVDGEGENKEEVLLSNHAVHLMVAQVKAHRLVFSEDTGEFTQEDVIVVPDDYVGEAPPPGTPADPNPPTLIKDSALLNVLASFGNTTQSLEPPFAGENLQNPPQMAYVSNITTNEGVKGDDVYYPDWVTFDAQDQSVLN